MCVYVFVCVIVYTHVFPTYWKQQHSNGPNYTSPQILASEHLSPLKDGVPRLRKERINEPGSPCHVSNKGKLKNDGEMSEGHRI